MSYTLVYHENWLLYTHSYLLIYVCIHISNGISIDIHTYM